MRFLLIGLLGGLWLRGQYILIPMDESQSQHLRAYGLVYGLLARGVPVDWLLNYRGGSFAFMEVGWALSELQRRDIRYEQLSVSDYGEILRSISRPEVNMDVVRLEKAPRIAVYAPKSAEPWDDAVQLVLLYAEIPYDIIYDDEVLSGKISEYDWIHLHHEDFTGQYGKFFTFRDKPWYKAMVRELNLIANRWGYRRVPELKLAVVKKLREWILSGGFLFAMCSATDTYDIALAAEGVDIVSEIYDNTPADALANTKLRYDNCIAFHNFTLRLNPYDYEFSDIDTGERRRQVREEQDYFTLREFSAKWDPIPTMLCQNHRTTIKGFYGQTTGYEMSLLKPNVVVMGECVPLSEARYIHGILGRGFWTFYGGHDPEDYQHFVEEPPTDVSKYPSSPGYRLILNNVLFPAAKRKKMKT
ncbi:MAG: asparagine synthetase B [Bacteroidia bacterium]|nr:asparagine synthetase B [Bacteroidia bacterium]MCX7651559.1 asparagine synthetase B [Bacteroidia bacterium]MDW8417265.1 asparagine synthetase B [Bacteroidia bacterium]